MTRKLNIPRLPVKVLTALFVMVVFLLSATAAHATPAPNLLISQIFGGGGNSGAVVPNDYVELINLSASPINLSGYSLQYSAAAGNSIAGTHVLSGTIAAGHYFLVEESVGANANNLTFPVTPDIASGPLAISSTGGMVLLVNGTTAVTGTGTAMCSSAGVVDAVGWGGGVCGEGTPIATATTNLNYLQRNILGCANTFNNTSDFTITTLTTSSMHTSATTPTNCPPTLGNGTVTPTTVQKGSSIIITVTATPSTSPFSSTTSAVKVTSALTGDTTAQALTNTSGNTYSLTFALSGTQVSGSFPLTVALTDSLSDALPLPIIIPLTVGALDSTSTTLTIVPTAPLPNQSTTLTATLGNTFSPTAATGTYTFFNDVTPIGSPVTISGATASTTVAAGFPLGGQNLSAVYSGNSVYATSTGSLSIGLTATVTPDFTLGLSNSQIIGSSATPVTNVGVNITGIGGFSSTITLSCSGLPSNVSCAFAPSTVTPTAGAPLVSSVLTFTTNTSANIKPGFPGKAGGKMTGGLAVAFTLLVAPFAFRKRKPALRMLALLVILLAGMQVLTGCSAKTVTAGTTSVTVTAAGGGMTHSGTITVITE